MPSASTPATHRIGRGLDRRMIRQSDEVGPERPAKHIEDRPGYGGGRHVRDQGRRSSLEVHMQTGALPQPIASLCIQLYVQFQPYPRRSLHCLPIHKATYEYIVYRGIQTPEVV